MLSLNALTRNIYFGLQNLSACYFLSTAHVAVILQIYVIIHIFAIHYIHGLGKI